MCQCDFKRRIERDSPDALIFVLTECGLRVVFLIGISKHMPAVTFEWNVFAGPVCVLVNYMWKSYA